MLPGEIMLWWKVLVLAMVVVVPSLPQNANGDPQVPCYFIFGDSLADNGNNNNLDTLAKVNYPPYGIDFPDGPTGRFCNGRTYVDVIAQLLGFENFIPPFASANMTELSLGVNYASGSAGILDESGYQLGQHISLDHQLQNHLTTVTRLIDIIGDIESTFLHLSKCLYSVEMGNNDYINNYFLPEYYNTSKQYTLLQFTELLIQRYTQQLTTLYNYGARKIAVFGLGELGCTPGAIDAYGTNGSACVDIMNVASLLFNSKLLLLIDQLNRDYSDAQFIYINSFGIGMESSSLDFEVDNAGCCPVNEYGQCIADQVPCQNRTEYAFWDAFHPTETFNVFMATRSYNSSSPLDAYPFNILQLALLNLGSTMSY